MPIVVIFFLDCCFALYVKFNKHRKIPHILNLNEALQSSVCVTHPYLLLIYLALNEHFFALTVRTTAIVVIGRSLQGLIHRQSVITFTR